MRNIYLLLIAFSFVGSRAQQIEWIDSLSYSAYQSVSKIDLDNNGNIYIAGFYASATAGAYGPGSNGTFIHKYSPNGDLLWKDKTYAPGGGPQSAGLATDSEGNVYTALWNSGQSNTIQIGNSIYPGGINGFLIKYNSSGNILWVKTLPGAITNDIAIDQSQNVLLSCYNTVRKFNPSGDLITSFPIEAGILKLDNHNAMYCTGSQLQKFDQTGNLNWTYPLTANYRIAPDNSGNCYASDMGAYGTSSIYKINSGQLMWSYTVPYWGGEGIYRNESDKLFVIGEYGTGNTTLGQILCEYDDQGTNIWSYNIPNSANIGPGPIIEQNGSIYIGGQDKQYQSFVYLMKIKSPDAPMAVHENSADSRQFNLYPNPSGSIFNLSYEGEANARTTLKVLDAAGKILYTKNLNDFASGIQQQLDLSSLPKGIYFLHLLGEKFTETRKIIIE